MHSVVSYALDLCSGIDWYDFTELYPKLWFFSRFCLGTLELGQQCLYTEALPL